MAFDLTAARPEIATQDLTCPTSSLCLDDGVSPMCQCVCVRMCVILSHRASCTTHLVHGTQNRSRQTCAHTDDAFAFAAGPSSLAARARRCSGGEGRPSGARSSGRNPLAVAWCAGKTTTQRWLSFFFTPRPARRLAFDCFVVWGGENSSFRTEPTNICLYPNFGAPLKHSDALLGLLR